MSDFVVTITEEAMEELRQSAYGATALQIASILYETMRRWRPVLVKRYKLDQIEKGITICVPSRTITLTMKVVVLLSDLESGAIIDYAPDRCTTLLSNIILGAYSGIYEAAPKRKFYRQGRVPKGIREVLGKQGWW